MATAGSRRGARRGGRRGRRVRRPVPSRYADGDGPFIAATASGSGRATVRRGRRSATSRRRRGRSVGRGRRRRPPGSGTVRAGPDEGRPARGRGPRRSTAGPTRSSWSASLTIVPSPAVRAGRRASVSSIRARRPDRLHLVGHQVDEHPPEPDRLVRQVDAHQVVAGCGGVTLGEDQRDRGQHGAQRSGSSAGRGIRSGGMVVAQLRWPRTMRWAMVASGTRKARAISGVLQPAEAAAT